MSVTDVATSCRHGGFWALPTRCHIPCMRGVAVAHPRHCERQRSNPSFGARGENGLLRLARNDAEIATQHSIVIPRRRGSSTPRLIGSITAVSGMLDRPPEPVIGRAFARPVGGR